MLNSCSAPDQDVFAIRSQDMQNLHLLANQLSGKEHYQFWKILWTCKYKTSLTLYKICESAY